VAAAPTCLQVRRQYTRCLLAQWFRVYKHRQE
jgi:hypothetical protein